MYNIAMADNDMLETDFLFQPRGPGTGWCFRMITPAALVGKLNPRTERPYGREIREGLGTRNLKDARKLRDLYLGKIRLEESGIVASANGSMDEALCIAASLKAIDDDGQLDDIKTALVEQAERLEKRVGEKKAVRWSKTAVGERTPFKLICERYVADAGKGMSMSTINNLNTATKELRQFAGEDVALEEIDRRMVAEFVTEHLPNKKGPKAPTGQGPATIRKKVSQLGQIWVWARKRGNLPRTAENPWHEQAPTAKEVKADAAEFRIFTPEEVKKLLAAIPAGKPLGDVIRVALLTGVRLEEVAGLDASQVDAEARWYFVRKGKSDNAPRYVPLVDMARDVIKARLLKVESQGPLFPDVPVRKSTGKQGGALSQAFTRQRRKLLGEETDGHLKQHCFRHLWRTMAGRAGVNTDHTLTMGGWAIQKRSDLPYDHGLELEQYCREQEKIAQWMRDKGYLP